MRSAWMSLLAGLVCLATARESVAYEVKKTPQGKPVHWSVGDVPFHFDDSIDDAAKGARDAIRAAGGAWSGVGGAPTISFADDGGGAAPKYDGKSTIYFAPEGSALARSIAGNRLAITILTYDETGVIVDADIVVNGHYRFAVLDQGARPGPDDEPIANEGGGDEREPHGAFDLQRVVAHEMGHALGLADETSSDQAAMYQLTSPGDASHRGPLADDAAGVASLYADASANGGTSAAGCGASVSPRTPSRGAFGFVAIALGALLTRRSRYGRSRRTSPTAPGRTGASSSPRRTPRWRTR